VDLVVIRGIDIGKGLFSQNNTALDAPLPKVVADTVDGMG